MADKIVAAVRLKRKVLEGVDMQQDIVTILQEMSRKVLFSAPGPETDKIRQEMVDLLQKEYFPLAEESGRKSAVPILERLGVEPTKRLSGAPLGFLSGYRQKNTLWFSKEVETGTKALSSQLQAEIARASRDGVSRRRMITNVIDSYNAELRAIKTKRKSLAEANKALANAEATGDIKAIKAARKVRNNAAAATRRVTTAMGRLENRVQGAARDAVRREAQRGQLAQYRQEGFTVYTWVAVNGSLACPDCTALHNQTRSYAQWHGEMPGDGHTVCMDSCVCELVPEQYVTNNKSLEQPVNPYLFDELK